MLKEDLLLDSARPFSDEIHNVECGHPEHSLPGAPQSCQWYALRATYSRELKVKEKLDAIGVRTFVPMMWRTKTVEGKSERKLVPAVGNLCLRIGQDRNLTPSSRVMGKPLLYIITGTG